MTLMLHLSSEKDEEVELRKKDRDATRAIPLQKAPKCPRCELPMLFFENAGMWICREGPRCSGTLARRDAGTLGCNYERERTDQQLDLVCPLWTGASP